MKASYIICVVAAMVMGCDHENICANVRQNESPDGGGSNPSIACVIVESSGTVTVHQENPTADGGGGGGPALCQSTLTYSGTQDEIAATYSVAPTWRYVPSADVSVSNLQPSLLNPLNIGWTIRVYADDGTGIAPTTPPTVIAKSDVGGVFDPPITLSANGTYWIAIKAVSNGMNEYLTLLTSDLTEESMMWWDGIFWQIEENQGPREMTILGACP